MSEVQQPVHHTPAVVPASEHNAAVTSASDAPADPIRSQETSELSPESRPELGQSGITDGTITAAPTAPNVTNVPKEEKIGKGEVLIESHPINEGVLNYKGPGLKGLIFSKKYFWFSDAPLEHKHLSAYLGNEKSKDIAHPNAAHAQQTGKGLLFFAKRAEDKDHPQGIFNLGDITDVVKGNFNDFGFSLHGQKHQFQAVTKAEKDGWIVALETRAAQARSSREGIVASPGYKSALESYGGPAAGANTGTSRSLSRPGKKASKSRERKIGATKTDNITPTVVDTSTTTPSGVTTENVPETNSGHTNGTAPGHHASEAAAGGAAIGAVAGAATTRSGSPSDEDKKTKKSRSQSRNKRGSLFGNLLAKKEDHDVKKEMKKEEKEEKAEEKAIKKEVKKEDKLEKKEVMAELKAEKKEEAKVEKALEKAGDPLSTGQTPGFNAHAVAARVIAEPAVPAGGNSTAVDDISPVATSTESASAAPIAAEITPTSATPETVPKPNKRASIFGGLFGKKEVASPAATETGPAVPVKDEPPAVSSTAPQLDSPVTQPTTEPVPETAATGTSAAATESTRPGAATTGTTEKRRSSFFNNLGTKKERRTGTTSGDELTDGEGKKQPSGGFGGLLRKASRAQKGSSSAPKDAADVPVPKETAAPAPTHDGISEGKPALSGGEAGANAINESHEQTPVSAAA